MGLRDACSLLAGLVVLFSDARTYANEDRDHALEIVKLVHDAERRRDSCWVTFAVSETILDQEVWAEKQRAVQRLLPNRRVKRVSVRAQVEVPYLAIYAIKDGWRQMVFECPVVGEDAFAEFIFDGENELSFSSFSDGARIGNLSPPIASMLGISGFSAPWLTLDIARPLKQLAELTAVSSREPQLVLTGHIRGAVREVHISPPMGFRATRVVSRSRSGQLTNIVEVGYEFRTDWTPVRISTTFYGKSGPWFSKTYTLLANGRVGTAIDSIKSVVPGRYRVHDSRTGKVFESAGSSIDTLIEAWRGVRAAPTKESVAEFLAKHLNPSPNWELVETVSRPEPSRASVDPVRSTPSYLLGMAVVGVLIASAGLVVVVRPVWRSQRR